MPWFVVDDSAHSHPKMVKAGNAAVGLWMRCGSYAAQHLTDGIVPGDIARMYGTAPQINKLVKLRLWHPSGHACEGCVQPPAGDYVMHDYLAYNPTRKQVADRRAKAAEKKRRQRDGGGRQKQNAGVFDDESRANRERIEDESSSIHRPVFYDNAGQDDVSPGDSLGTRARAFPSPPLLQEDVAGVSGGSTGSSERAISRPDGLAPIDIDGFALTDAMRRWAKRDGYSDLVDIDHATAQFISHYRSTGSRRSSWPDAWQKWIRDDAKRAAERRTSRPLHAVNSTGARAQTHTADDYTNSSVEDLFAS
jgi:hypothetical protein